MRVDATLQPSRYRHWATMACYLVVAGMWLVSPFDLGLQIVGVLLLGLGGWAAACHQQRQAQCISVYQRDDGGWQWQTDEHERWVQGRLQRVTALSWVIVLVFDCSAIKRQVRVVIWQDQVDATQWRRLQVVGAWYGNRASLIEG